MKLYHWLLITALGGISHTASGQCVTSADQINVNGTCTKIKTYQSNKLTGKPNLLVTLHGDSPFSGPSYQYFFASTVASDSENLVSVGLLRPGYTDAMNRTSDGIRGLTNGENYSDDRVTQIALAIKQLKAHYQPKQLILAGHSGGGAITAKIIASFPQLVDHAVIVSCPCDINNWRKSMYAKWQYPNFKGDIEVKSPVDLVSQISESTKVTLFVGQNDQVTPLALTQQYKSALDAKQIETTMYVIDGEHDIFLFPQITSFVSSLMNDV